MHRKALTIHSVCWITAILLMLLLGSKNFVITHELIIVFVYFGILNIIVFYTNYSWMLPSFLAKKKYKQYVLSGLLVIAVMGFLKYGMASLFEKEILMRDAGSMPFLTYYFHTLLVSTFFIFLSSAIHFTVDWFLHEKARKSFEKEKLEAELAFLRTQINPHFLLNSLNTIYSLAYQRSEKTPEAILKLSDIMKYMLYENNDMKVEISKELHYIENYIELQRIRSKDSAAVNLSVLCEDDAQPIVPLILIPFIENAFKHGVINDAAHPVEIVIRVTGNTLFFSVANSKGILNKDDTGGIGLQNVKRRLELLYPGKHSLIIKDESTTYTCELTLDL